MNDTNRTFRLGGKREIDRLGYGAMRLTGQPGNFGRYPRWDDGKALLRRAVELGVNFVDSARAYGPEWADKLIADALHPYGEDLVVATKGGVDKAAPDRIVTDGRPDVLRAHVDAALANLKTERIELFQLHRVDPDVPVEESVGALEDARKAGKLRLIGLSNVDREQLDRALTVAPIASVQNRYNRAEREQDALVDYTAAQGIAFIPYGPLGAHPMKQGGRAAGTGGAGVVAATLAEHRGHPGHDVDRASGGEPAGVGPGVISSARARAVDRRMRLLTRAVRWARIDAGAGVV